jgi:nucleoside-diphosphate-sugar epimerase
MGRKARGDVAAGGSLHTVILVTGASGFVGRHVMRALKNRGIAACGTGRHPASAGDAPLIHLDLDRTATLPGIDQLGRPEAVVHLAWGGLPHFKSQHHLDIELDTQWRFLEHLVKQGLERLVVAGTCLEYGMHEGELTESMPAMPSVPYAQAKLQLCKRLEALSLRKPFAFTWARLFYMHGAGQAPNSLLPALHAAAERGDTEFPMSGGEQLRDYLPVSEVAATLVQLALQQRGQGIVNVCSGWPISVKSLIASTIASQGWSIQPRFGVYGYPDYEPMAFWGSRAKLDAILRPTSHHPPQEFP